VVVRGVRMFLGLAPERDHPVWGPLSEVTHLCGLTLQGGVEEDLGGTAEGAERHQPARNRDHLRLVSHRSSP